MDDYQEDHYSDDEIFFGDLTLNEIRKHILPDNYRQTIACVDINCSEDDNNKSLKIIETHSTPDIVSLTMDSLLEGNESASSSNSSPDAVPCNWDIKANDSFLKIEQMVSNLCVSQTNNVENVLDNTLDVVEYILHNGPLQNIPTHSIRCDQTVLNEQDLEIINPNPGSEINNLCQHELQSRKTLDAELITPVKENHNFESTISDTPNSLTSPYYTPDKVSTQPEGRQPDIYATPSTELRNRTPLFKTPGNPVSLKKRSCTPLKKSFQHIVSPVASYIKQSPVVPLYTDIRPKKPLPGTSCIPKPIKNATKMNPNNKENVKLPSIAYKTAKETKVINTPDGNKMPKNQWAKQVASSIPKVVVLKHNHREVDSSKIPLKHRQEDSFQDLTLHQADLSVCTQKSALKKPKKLF